MVRYTQSEVTDDPRFLEWVEAVVTGVEESFKTDLAFVVKIDNWFGQRWLGFSGKTLGVAGVRKEKLTLPPFVPSRVLAQRRVRREGTVPGRHKRLHVWQSSGQNLQRYTEVVLHDAHAFWYSGGSASSDRASFMAYVSTPDGHWPWYVSLQRKKIWRVVECIGVRIPELDEFIRRGILQMNEVHPEEP
jgi:hypothetical protein